MQDDIKPDASADASPENDTLPSLEEALKAAELQAAEHHDAWLRAKAETENMRRRASEEADKARKFAVEGFAGELLAVKDSLEAALASDAAAPEKMREGVELTLKQLSAAFAKYQLVEEQPLGAKFDPHLHQAITAEERTDLEVQTNLKELKAGYLYHGILLRPAMVKVGVPKPKPSGSH